MKSQVFVRYFVITCTSITKHTCNIKVALVLSEFLEQTLQYLNLWVFRIEIQHVQSSTYVMLVISLFMSIDRFISQSRTSQSPDG